MADNTMRIDDSAETRSVRRIVRAMGLVLVLILGFGVPASFATISIIDSYIALQHEAEQTAAMVEEHVYRTAEMWSYQPERLEELLTPPLPIYDDVERTLISEGAIVAQTRTRLAARETVAAIPDDTPAWPRMSIEVPVRLLMAQVATVRLTASLRRQALSLGAIWLCFAALAGIAYHSLAVAPLRLLDRTIARLRDAAAEARAADIAKSDFLAAMSHEIRTPMNGILGMAELLETTGLDERQSKFSGIIRSSGQALLAVINDILDFSKIDAGHLQIDPQPFELGAMVAEPAHLVARAAAKKHIELLVRQQPSLPPGAVGDLGRLRQVVTNLLSNAVKFTERGQVVVDLSGSERRADDGTRAVELRVEVRDTGIGIAAHKRDAMFERFTQADTSSTRRHEGTGLGLAISKGLVELMGGRIGVESELGVGSTFWFTLTLPVSEAPARAPRALVAIEGRKVLVIDDNETNRCILDEMLCAWGLSPTLAASGVEGLRLLLGARKRGDPFDVLILDHHMPEMDGAQVIEALRASREIAATPVILLTSVDDIGPTGSMLKPDVQEYLVKPAPASQLFDAIVTTLGARAIRPAGAATYRPDAGTAEARLHHDTGVDVLLVEDNEVNAMVAGMVLTSMGLNHVTASDGARAAARFEATQPALVLMDVSMPVVDGYEATRRIRAFEAAKRLDRTPIIGLTAHAMQGDRERCLAAGMDDYVSKPVSTEKLAAVVAKWRAAAAKRPEEPAAGT